MKKIIILFAFLAVSINAAAAPMNAEIYYVHDTLNKYKIFLKLYRDCSSATLGNTQNVVVQSVSNSTTLNVSLQLDTSYNLYSCFPSSCISPSNNYDGYEVYHYSGDTTLPVTATDWNFIFKDCCRQTNQTGPTSFTTVFARLDNVNWPVNSTPLHPFNHQVIYAGGQLTKINFKAFDADGDSLAYHLTPARNNGPTSFANYIPPLSHQNPITTTPTVPSSITLDPVSGVLSFTGTQLGLFILAIEVREFRNGIEIASSVKDYYINIFGMNAAPELSGINGTNDYRVRVANCPNASVNFTVNSTDTNLLDSTKIYLVNKPVGSTFSTNVGQNETGTFAWSPPVNASLSAEPFLLVLEVRDNNCGAYQEVYQIFVDTCNSLSAQYFEKHNTINVYPNPAKSVATISIVADKKQDYQLVLYDIVGRVVEQNVFSGSLAKGEHTLELDLSDKAQGEYLLEIRTELGKKVIAIQRR